LTVICSIPSLNILEEESLQWGRESLGANRSIKGKPSSAEINMYSVGCSKFEELRQKKLKAGFMLRGGGVLPECFLFKHKA